MINIMSNQNRIQGLTRIYIDIYPQFFDKILEIFKKRIYPQFVRNRTENYKYPLFFRLRRARIVFSNIHCYFSEISSNPNAFSIRFWTKNDKIDWDLIEKTLHWNRIYPDLNRKIYEIFADTYIS